MSRNPEYLTKPLAAKALGISPRRLVELAAAGHIRRHYHDDPKLRRRIVLFEKAEIDQLLAKRSVEEIPGSAVIPSRLLEPLMQSFETYNRRSASEAAAPKFDALWLTPAEAAGYSGLPESFLIRMIQAKQLPAINVGPRPGGRWRISRRDLDAIRADASALEQSA